MSTDDEREGINHKYVKDQEELGQIIELFRKLREAIFATRWSNHDLNFSIQGNERIVDCYLSITPLIRL